MDRGEELALVHRLRDGDSDAFDRIHQAFNARLFSFLLRLSHRRDVAEDVLEEDTWLRLAQQSGRLRADTCLGPWLFTVARNLYISHLRSRRVEQSHADLIGLWPDAPAPRSPFDDAAASELSRRLETALATLPDWARDVLLLVGVDGLTPRDAAEVCGLTPEALRQRLSRARTLLVHALNPDDGRRTSILREVTS